MVSAARRYSAGLRLLFAACTLVTGSGCITMPASGSLPFLGTDEEQTSDTPPAATCSVELRPSGRRTQTVDIPLSEETRVQDVLDASRATSKFRNLDVVILRPTQNPSEPLLKLACRFDRRNRRIGWESDYAVLPGDRVVVREDTAAGFDKILGSVLGPVLGGR